MTTITRRNMVIINQLLVNLVALLLMMLLFGGNLSVQSRNVGTKENASQLLYNFLETLRSKASEQPSTGQNSPSLDRQNLDASVLEPQTVSIDPKERLVFWLQPGPPHQIWRSNLQSDTDHIIIVPEIFILPTWLVADYSKQRLYFADSDTRNTPLVHSVNYDGQNYERETFSELLKLFASSNKLGNFPSLHTNMSQIDFEKAKTGTRQRFANDISEIRCPATFHHGSVEENCSLQPGSYCTFTCENGFEPVSYLTMWCLGTGNWSHNVHKLCREVTCSDPRPQLTTTIESCTPPHYPGKECVFRCPIGLDVVGGSEVITCNEHGDWTDTPVSCAADYSYSAYGYSYFDLEPLEFTARPADSLLNFGDIKLLNCATNDESVTIQWFKDGEQLPSESLNDVFVLSGGTLFISRVQEDHAGLYTCKAYRASSRENIQAEGYLSFSEEQVFETSPSNAFIVVGDDHVVQCMTRDPTLVVTWEKDGAVLQYSEAIHKVPQSDNLLIRGAFLTDSGRYTCVAMTFDGNRVAETSADLNVLPRQDVKEVCGTITAPAAVFANMMRDEDEREGRIVNGTISIHGSAPWIARLWNRNMRRHFCAASLINRMWAVTAAHCIIDSGIKKEDLIIRVGDFDTYARESDEQLLTVASIIVNDEFNSVDFDNDIALIKLAEPVEMFDDYVRPICVPNITTGDTLLTQGAKGQVVGWGRVSEEGHFSQFMKEVMLQVRNDDVCKRSSSFVVTNNMFCAGNPKRQGDACEGDSGGSFAVQQNGRWYLTGVVSWGEGCAREGKYGFYTKVPLLYEWIHNTIANN